VTPLFTDAVVFDSPLVRIGAFRCAADYPGFQDTGPIQNDCFVFPRTAVRIEHEHEPAFATNANVITFYNRSQRYLRHKVSDQGDRCDWFAIDRAIAREITGADEEHPFAWTRRACDSRAYLAQRRIFRMVTERASVDSVAIEEAVIHLLECAVHPTADPPPLTKRQRALALDVECLLGARFEQHLSLAEIGREVGASVYHLCRTFRRATGMPLHQYQQRLRLRHGLEPVMETRDPLSRVAVDLGFTHHSHFTAAFHREFGETPSVLRGARL
jgi:AraC family transcriptional regulator